MRWQDIGKDLVPNEYSCKDLIQVKDKYRNNKSYNGVTKKFGITINDIDYIVKFKKGNDLSVYTEYIASTFINQTYIPCQEVKLGIYKNELVDCIKDFTHGKELHSFKDTKQSSEATDLTDKEYTYYDVIYLIEKHLKMSEDNKVDAISKFWDMFICDAILGNRDRHWGNWGYLQINNSYVFSPLYDNGSSLFPGMTDDIINRFYHGEWVDIIKERVFEFPASLLKEFSADLNRTKRTNYYQMFNEDNLNKYNNFKERLIKFKDTYNYHDIIDFTYKSVDIFKKDTFPEEYKTKCIIIWQYIILARFLCIILRWDFDYAISFLRRYL